MSLDRMKTFSFTNYDCIGFDLDHTLARFKLEALMKTIYKDLANHLIKKGYPDHHLSKPVEQNVDFLMKGLILDTEKGNILHVDSNGCIIRGSHGTKDLEEAELSKYYGRELKWEPTNEFFGTLKLSEGDTKTIKYTTSEKIQILSDYYQVPAGLAFARAVDTLDETMGGKPLDSYNIYPHLKDALEEIFSGDSFRLAKGSMHRYLKKYPGHYYRQCSEDLVDWLKELKKQRKVLFIITGSDADYASYTAKKVLGSQWSEIFDLSVFGTKKPGFFTEDLPFVDNKGYSKVDITNSKQGTWYTQGNWQGLRQFLVKASGKDDPKIVFCGDNLVEDIHAPSTLAKWDTVALCEELQAEGISEEDKHPDEAYLSSKKWGSYFNHGETCTVWSDLITSHAKMCVSSLEYVASFRVDHEFKTCPLI